MFADLHAIKFQVSLPVQFSNDSVLTLNPESIGLASPMTTASSEFHSLSFTMRKVDLDDCIIAQLTEIWQLNVVRKVLIHNVNDIIQFIYRITTLM